MNNTTYKNRLISLKTEEFGNGTAVEVSVDGATVLALYDARALFTTEEEALRQGMQFGKDVIDGNQSAVGSPTSKTRRENATVKAHNPGDHSVDS